jgi:hypothetical protein
VNSRLPLTGRNASSLGTPLQRALQGPVTEREDTATSRARKTRHCVKRQGQACLHPQQDRQQKQLTPAGRNNPSHATTTSHNNYTLRSPRSFPRTLQSLSNHLCGGGDVGTSHSHTDKQTPCFHHSRADKHTPWSTDAT